MTLSFRVAILIASATAILFGVEPRNLTLSEAVRLALTQNHELRIARFKVLENEEKKAASRAGYFPEIKNQSTVARTTAEEHIGIPAGAFGVYSSAGPVPGRDVLINQGDRTIITSGTMATQPLTPLIRIHAANVIAHSEIVASRADLKRAENEVAVRVHEVYYGILTTRLQKLTAQQEGTYSRTRLRESEDDVRDGSALKVSAIEGQAGVLQSEQTLLTLDLHLADLTAELNELLGLPLETKIELSPVEPAVFTSASHEESLQMALAENPEITAAAEKVRQAKAGVTAAKSAYIPDVAAFARQSYQDGVPFLIHNFGTYGVSLDYDVFDFGKRRAVVREREDQLAEAQENLDRVKESIGVRIERSVNKVERTGQMLKVAGEVAKLRSEGERLAANQLTQGVILASARYQASAANYRAQADLLQAQLAHLLAQAELEQAIGRTPGQ